MSKGMVSPVDSRSVVILVITTTIGLLLAQCGHKPAEMVAFINLNLVPMTAEIVIEDQTVLVEGSKIAAIGDCDAMQIPEGALVIDGQGAYLMPSLADMHMHTREDWDDPEIWPVHPLVLYLANGVTTIRDCAPRGSSLTYALEWRDDIRNGKRTGPTIYASGKLLYASPLEDPEAFVLQNFEQGFDFLKLYSYLPKDDFRAAMTAAKAVGMYTAGHIPYAVGLEGVLSQGMDEIAHVEELLPEFFDFDRGRQLEPKEWLTYIAESALRQLDISSSSLEADFERENTKKMARITEQLQVANIAVGTTMVVDEVMQLKLFQPQAFLDRPENVYLETGYLQNFLLESEKHQVQCRGIEGLCAFKYGIDRWVLDSLHDAGIMLLLGTDSGTGGMGLVPGYSIHDELRILVENGFSPYEALATGTINAATVIERMTGEGNLGVIEKGKQADLILVRENPLKDISVLKELLGVMSAGRWYSKETLDQLTAAP